LGKNLFVVVLLCRCAKKQHNNKFSLISQKTFQIFKLLIQMHHTMDYDSNYRKVQNSILKTKRDLIELPRMSSFSTLARTK
jgi:hypothetical protein